MRWQAATEVDQGGQYMPPVADAAEEDADDAAAVQRHSISLFYVLHKAPTKS